MHNVFVDLRICVDPGGHFRPSKVKSILYDRNQQNIENVTAVNKVFGRAVKTTGRGWVFKSLVTGKLLL